MGHQIAAVASPAPGRHPAACGETVFDLDIVLAASDNRAVHHNFNFPNRFIPFRDGLKLDRHIRRRDESFAGMATACRKTKDWTTGDKGAPRADCLTCFAGMTWSFLVDLIESRSTLAAERDRPAGARVMDQAPADSDFWTVKPRLRTSAGSCDSACA